MKPAERVLVVAAHPDDEILGCGATVARHAAEGARVRSLVLGEGVTSRRGLSSARMKKALKELGAAAAKANRILGVERVDLRSFPDNRFDTVARLDIVHAVEAVIEEFDPGVIYTHGASDLNVDHQIVSEAVRTACRPLPGSRVREVLSFEVPSATEWRFSGRDRFEPVAYRDVGDYIELKIRALAVYEGEMRAFPHPRSAEYIRALARLRGSQSGFRAAEAFELIRRIEA